MPQSNRSQIDRIAEKLQFDAPLTIYQQVLSPAMKRKKYGGMLLCIILIMFFPSVEFLGALLSTPRQVSLIWMTMAFFVPLCLFTIVLTILFLYRATIPWLVYLYTEGFISAKGRKIESVPWDQVQAISRVLINCDLIERRDGKPLFFDNTFLNLATASQLDPRERDWPFWRMIGRQETEIALLQERWLVARKQTLELMHVLEREITTRLFPNMVADFQAGLPVAFGSLELSREGVNDGKQLLHWEQLDQIILWGEEDGLLLESVPYAKGLLLAERLAWW